jgi:hypothetical protein
LFANKRNLCPCFHQIHFYWFFVQAAQEAFRQLLDENFEKLKHDTTDEDLKVLLGDDSRFKNLEPKERKAILYEKLAPLKKIHQESTFQSEAYEKTANIRIIT